MSPPAEHPVFVKRGDALAEVDRLLAELGGDRGLAGFHKYFYVEQAQQTVVMVTAPDTPLARALRGRAGWLEPGASATG